jgi:hypothetical protein
MLVSNRGHFVIGWALVLALLAVACGGDDNPAATAAPGAATQAAAAGPAGDDDGDDGAAAGDDGGGDAPAPQLPAGVTGDGGITIDGESYAVEAVFRCEPFNDGERDLDLTAMAGTVTFFVYISEFMGVSSHELSLQGPMGIFSGMHSQIGDDWFDENLEPVDGPPFEVDGNRVRGAMTLIEAREGVEAIDVSFELPIPSEMEAC